MLHWYTRYEISNAIDGRGTPTGSAAEGRRGSIDRGELARVLARGHAARCAACQGFAARLEVQHAQLTLGAATARAPVVARPRRRTALQLGAPLALGAAIALAITLSGRSPAPIAPEVAATPPAQPIAARVSELFVTASEPLDAELGSLLRDGRRGLDTVLATGGLGRLVDRADRQPL